MPNLPVELRVPSYNFCSPNTKLKERLSREDEPINRVDAICLTHDIEYENAKDRNDILLADLEMKKGEARFKMRLSDNATLTYGGDAKLYKIVDGHAID